MAPVTAPRTGPCSPWADTDDVNAIGADLDGIDPAKLTLNLEIASELLFIKSAMQFPGTCSETLRPITRLDLVDQSLLWWQSFGYPYIPDLIEGAWYNFGPGWGFGVTQPPPSMGLVWEGGHMIPRIDLGQYPVTEVTGVKVDGVALDPANYRLDDWRYLVRTDGNLWPTNQNLLLADTEVGTWSVSLSYGQPAPQSAVTAAAQLAYELTLHTMGDTARCKLPLRVTAVTRQGVTYSMANVMDILNKSGGTGLYFVDLFVKTFNPNGLQRPARVLTPDLKPYRRLGSTTG